MGEERSRGTERGRSRSGGGGDRRGRGGNSGGGESRGRRDGGGYGRRPKRCSFCAEKVTHIDYKKPDVLRYFLNEQGKIRPRRQTGTCAKHQRRLCTAIKRARHLAMLRFVADDARRR